MMVVPESYLIDTNSLITPKATYYPMDLVPRFWQSMAEKIEDGSVAILDIVKQEILKRKDKDDLALWMHNLVIGCLVNHRQQNIVVKYAEVLQYIQDNPCYSEKALREWSEETVADAWLIAAAAVRGFTIVTFEKPVLVDANNPSKKAKIPNVAHHFKVRTIDLFGMIRELGIAL
jgi:hypothetical protein